MSFQPLFDRVLVEVSAASEKSAGGIILTENSQPKILQGEVVAVGPGIVQNGVLIETTVEEGNTVSFQRGAGIEVVDNGVRYLLLREVDILGINS